MIYFDCAATSFQKPASVAAAMWEALASMSSPGRGGYPAAARAAAQGAEATRQFVSKFGRARSYGEKTIGTPDAGAVSMSRFFQGLAS